MSFGKEGFDSFSDRSIVERSKRNWSSEECDWFKDLETSKEERWGFGFPDDLGLAPSLPEDMYFLIKKAVAIRKHLERNRKDRDAKFRLIMVESRIHRLTRYYKRTEQLPPSWK